MLVIIPVKVIDSIHFRMLVVISVKIIDSISFSYVGHYPSKDNWRYFLSYVDSISFRMWVIISVQVIDGISAFVCKSLPE